MQIVIIGIGKVWLTIVDHLSKEGHGIVIIDNNKKVVEKTVNDYDVMGVLGNGADHNVQREAHVDTCDLVIAATSSDELNILCCMVAKTQQGGHNRQNQKPQYFTLFMGDELSLT